MQQSQEHQNNQKLVKTLEEEVMEREIKAVEKTRLEAVFKHLCSLDPHPSESFGTKSLYSILGFLKYEPARDEVEQMVWEVDEDLDNRISWYEFQLMFKRCITDITYLEPRSLFNLVQFLMYLQPNKTQITIEDTLELLFVRCGRSNLDFEIEKIFGKDEKTADGQEKEINFQEYLNQMKKKDYAAWTDLENKRKKFDPSKEALDAKRNA